MFHLSRTAGMMRDVIRQVPLASSYCYRHDEDDDERRTSCCRCVGRCPVFPSLPAQKDRSVGHRSLLPPRAAGGASGWYCGDGRG